MYRMTEVVTDILPPQKPRYLMGVGTPANILECIALGVDMFDCVLPTRNARHGLLFTQKGIINIRNEKWKNDFSPLDEDGTTFVDQAYSKAYLRHLLVCNEMLAAQIASVHNLGMYLWLVQEARKRIIGGTFTEWKNKLVTQLAQRL
jgi:queuine tRNA-ribosyltransferase